MPTDLTEQQRSAIEQAARQILQLATLFVVIGDEGGVYGIESTLDVFSSQEKAAEFVCNMELSEHIVRQEGLGVIIGKARWIGLTHMRLDYTGGVPFLTEYPHVPFELLEEVA